MAAPRSFGSSVIHLGLVAIPVKLFSATDRDEGVHFRNLHACGQPLEQYLACPEHGPLAEDEKPIKGYEFARDHYVKLTGDEVAELFEHAAPIPAITVLGFLDPNTIPRIYFDSPYYLGPDLGGDRGFATLAEALRRKKRGALAQSTTSRGREHLVILLPLGRGLVLHQLRYHAAIRPIADVPVGETKTTPTEVRLMIQLLSQLAVPDFRPEVFSDRVKARVVELLEKRANGESVALGRPAPGKPTELVELGDALKRSVELHKAKRPPTRPANGKLRSA